MKLQIIVVTLVYISVETQAGGEIISTLLSEINPVEVYRGANLVYGYAMEIYDFVQDIRAEQRMRNNVVEILDKVGAISKRLDAFESFMDTKLDAMLDTLMLQINVAPNLQYIKTKICEYINKIDHYFDKTRVFTIGKLFNNETLQRFGDSALWIGDNLPDILENLHDLMVPSLNKKGFVSYMLRQNMIKRSDECDVTESAQQKMYHTFIQVTMAEIKGLIALEQIYLLQEYYDEDSHDYKYEMKIVRENFQRRMKTYYDIMIDDLALFTRDLRRCEQAAAHGVNYEVASSISLKEQITDLHNNMVVTGVQFHIVNGVLHIQIEQAEFSYSGMISNNRNWKPVDVGFTSDNLVTLSNVNNQVPMDATHRTLHLDEIMVPENCVIIGVRFKLIENPSAFMLQVLATEYDFSTDSLYSYGSQWIDATTHPAMPKEYERPRKEIKMQSPDNPTRATNFQYEVGSNKLIKFANVAREKDPRQPLIPLVDILPVRAQPAFPIGGIGLSFRGKVGYGGYIVLRIYTMNVKGYVEVSEFFKNSQTATGKTWLCTANA